MKVSTRDLETLPSSYPFLAVSTRNQAVVLFIADGEGVCVNPGGNNSLGEYSKNWAMTAFKPYTGQLILEND